jgi:hypothetical protein
MLSRSTLPTEVTAPFFDETPSDVLSYSSLTQIPIGTFKVVSFTPSFGPPVFPEVSSAHQLRCFCCFPTLLVIVESLCRFLLLLSA